MRIGVPVKPMLAKPTKGIHIVLARFTGIKFTCEYKYDGYRAQVHFDRNNKEQPVRIFSRNLENMTITYPDVVEAMQINVPDNIDNCIIDAELVAYDLQKEKILPFQAMTHRSKKNVTADDLKIKLCIYAFDLLYINNEPLINEDFITRRTRLHESLKEVKGQMHFAEHLDATEFEQIETFLNESVKNGCEGLMVKTLEGDKATYEPDKRSFNWLKLKKDYLDSAMGDSLDLVVIGADFGKGKRVKYFGSFVLGCYDPESEKI